MELIISKIDNTFIKIDAEPGILRDLQDHFSFSIPGARFIPAFKRGWDGKIRLFKIGPKTIYAGLYHKIVEYAEFNGYSVSGYEPPLKSTETAQISRWVESLTRPGIQVRDYQISSLERCIQRERALILSPTGSGKSFLIYMLIKHYQKRTLIVVPTINLTSQMESDFRDYGFDGSIHTIHHGKEKEVDAQVQIGTFQSLSKMPKEWFKKFDMLIVDEAHLATSKSITSIVEQMNHVELRFGFTGTIEDSKCNAMILEGLFGEIYRTSSTSELIEKKILSDLNIECVTFKYTDEERKLCKTLTYAEEVDFIVRHERRNNIIKQLVLGLKGNSLLLFQYVDKHGKELYEMLKDCGRPVYYISGEISGQEREKIRKSIESDNNAILIASVGTVSTGVNIVSLKNIIFASPSKSKIRVLQSIGRVLRRSSNKDRSVLFDLSDDLSWKSRKNYTLKHFIHRLKIYNQEEFQYKIRTIKI